MTQFPTAAKALCLLLLAGFAFMNGRASEESTDWSASFFAKTGALRLLSGSKGLRFGVYMYRRTLERYAGKEEELVVRCVNAGIDEVYLAFSSRRISEGDADYLQSLRTLVSAFRKAGIESHALALDDPKLVFDPEKAGRIVETVASYNAAVPEDARFVGIAADIEPHALKEKNKTRHGDFPISWSTETYGIGGPNDRLVRKSLEVLEVVCKKAGTLPVSQAVAATVYRHLKRGGLSSGTPAEYLKAGCRFLVLMAYSNQANTVVNHAMPFLQDTPAPASVMIAVKTGSQATGDDGPTTTFSGLDRKQFLLKIETILETCSRQSALRGVSFFEYDGFEKILDTSPGK
jgi:hypothetical protein